MGSTDQSFAEIVIVRNAENDIKMRGLEIFVDDVFTHDLSYPKSYSIQVAPGHHRIKVSNHLYKKTLELDLEPGEQLQLLAGNHFTLLGGLMVSVLGMGPYRVFLTKDARPLSTKN